MHDLVEKGFEEIVGVRDVFRLQPENRHDLVTERLAGRQSLLARLEKPLAGAPCVRLAVQFEDLSGRASEDGHRAHDHRVDDQFHPFRRKNIVGDVDPSGVAEYPGNLLDAVLLRRIEGADPEPCPFLRGAAMDLSGLEQLRRKLNDAADGALDTDDFGNHFRGHAILYPYHQAVVGEIGLDELGQPARIVGLRGEKHDVEFFMERADVAQMMGLHLHIVFVGAGRDRQTVCPHRLDVGRPHVDHRNVQSRPDQIGRDNASVRTGRKHRNFLVHRVLPQCSVVRGHKVFLSGTHACRNDADRWRHANGARPGTAIQEVQGTDGPNDGNGVPRHLMSPDR